MRLKKFLPEEKSKWGPQLAQFETFRGIAGRTHPWDSKAKRGLCRTAGASLSPFLKVTCGVSLTGGATLLVDDFHFLGFLHKSALAMLSITLVRFSKSTFESLNFIVHIYKYVRVGLIFHHISPLIPLDCNCTAPGETSVPVRHIFEGLLLQI
jgi:hypothetical protein